MKLWRNQKKFSLLLPGGWDHLDSYRRLSLLSKLVLLRQMCDVTPDHPIRVRLPVAVVFGNKLCESRLSAHMIEDRALTGKQYESVNGV